MGSLGLVALTACRKRSDPVGSRGAPQRIVSLTPNTTETLFAIGAGNRLVGRSRYCDHPVEVRSLPAVGGFTDPSLEAILALRPDLVTGARGPAGPSIIEPLEERGIATFFPPTESMAQIEAMILGLSEKVERAEAGQALVESLRARRAAMAEAFQDAPRPRVLLVFGMAPIVVAGPGSFADEMLKIAGAENAVAEGIAYPVLGLERVLALDPDMVINAAVEEARAMGLEQLANEPGWRELRAVKTGQYRMIENDVVLRPGPRIGEGLTILARTIHPQRVIP